jgi:serine protease Do
MPNYRFLWVAGLIAATTVGADNNQDPLRPVVDKAIAHVKPALVRIQVVWVNYAQGREIKQQASGSGFIITKKGHVVTNHHVAGRATRIVCVFANNEEIEATLVGTDPLTDIAVLKLDNTKHAEYPIVEFADSNQVAPGDTVLAMGSPLALSQSVTRGIISNIKMVMPGAFRGFDRFTMEGEDVGALVRWIAHDASIYPGNSGGPLVNLDGRIIGVNEIGYGLSGAIPGNLAKEVAEQIIAHGEISRAWLGLEIQPLLKQSGLTRGALVAGIAPDSPAAAAGFQHNDILLRLAGQYVTVRFDEEIPLFNHQVCALPIGREIEAVVLRNGNELTLKAKAIEREPAEFRAREVKAWGLTVRNISLLAARELRLDSREGVLITSVRSGGPGGDAKPPVAPLDILRRVGDQPIKNLADFLRVTDEITKDQPEPVPTLVAFTRRNDEYVTVIKVGIRALEDPGFEARKAWLPVGVQAITRDIAVAIGSNSVTGVRVTQVYPQSTAAVAGLKVGDFIIGLDGEKIPAQQLGDEDVFTSKIRHYRVGAKPELTILRGKEVSKLTVELARSPQSERELKKYQDTTFEFTTRDLNTHDRVARDLAEDWQGVMVTEVAEGSWAALGGLFIGDLILAVNNEPVAGAADLEKKMAAITATKPKFILLRVQRGTHYRIVELEPNWNHQARSLTKGTPS